MKKSFFLIIIFICSCTKEEATEKIEKIFNTFVEDIKEFFEMVKDLEDAPPDIQALRTPLRYDYDELYEDGKEYKDAILGRLDLILEKKHSEAMAEKGYGKA